MKLTSAQQAAIDTKDKTLLLSAAAGSGKTSTLTKRIIQSITDKESPKDISRMLIVTFTRASAADLKAKIFNAISDALAEDPSNKHLSSQLIKLGSAKISTIDSFYLSAVKQNFSALGLSSAFRICDSSEAILIAKDIMNDVVNDFYEIDGNFASLCECFEKLRDTENVSADTFLSIYGDCMSTPEGVEYLRICAEETRNDGFEDFIDTRFGAILKEYSILMLDGYLKNYERVLEKIRTHQKLCAAYYDAFDSDRMLCIDALNILNGKIKNAGYRELCELFAKFQFAKLRPFKNDEELPIVDFAKSLRTCFKSSFDELRREYYCYSDNDLVKFYSLTSNNLETLYRVLSEFEKRFSEEKKRRNVMELTDIKRAALRLFATPDGAPTELARSYSEQFTDIYIDEYQDVDPVQDLIFRCISTPTNRFMVGDIKQSIYGFRGARPELFADYRQSFPSHGSAAANGSPCETIFMSENFRCNKSVIDFTNLICSPLFKAGNIGYSQEDDLVFAKGASEGSNDVEVAVFAKNSKKALEDMDIDPSSLPSPAEAEAQYVAQKIKELLESGRKNDGSPILPGDVAVLFRNKTHAKGIADELSRLGIASTNTENTQYFQNPDVMMTLCILNSIDNPQRDVFLAGALRSPIFGFSLDELLIINMEGDKTNSLYDKLCLYSQKSDTLAVKCAEFISTLDGWRRMSASTSIDKLLLHIFNSDAFLASGLVCEKDPLGEGGNLQRLYEYARTFEAGSFKGLYNFIEYVNSLIEHNETIATQNEGQSPDRVTLTTIHKSKGLEFPVCFICSCASDFKFGGFSKDISFEYGLGVAMTLSDSTGFAKYTSPLKKLIDLNARLKSVEEEMRVLYVALTRARERLYITASYPVSTLSGVSSAASFTSDFDCSFAIFDASCFMDWILASVYRSGKSCCKLFEFTTDALSFEEKAVLPSDEYSDSTDRVSDLYGILKESFGFRYGYSQLQKIPSKISVSKLSPDVLDSTDTSLNIFDVEKKPQIPAFFLNSPKKATSSERGTATHLFLQFCDFGLLKEKGVSAALDALLQKRFIPENLSEAIYTEEIEQMRNGELLNCITNAERIIREQRFNILLPARDFTRDSGFVERISDETIAVQGVIDLILVDKEGRISLYDYKTDRLTREELASVSLASKKMNDVHGLQLSYYARAVQLLFNKAPDRVAVFSTHASKVFDINVKELAIPEA